VKIETDAKQVTIFANSTDQYHGQALYAAIVQLCERLGIAGATVTRATEGYGAGRELHTTRLLELSQNMPVRIDIVDIRERIEPLLRELDTMITEGLVVLADVRVWRYLADPRS